MCIRDSKSPKPYLALYLVLFFSLLLGLGSALFYAKSDGPALLTSSTSALYPDSRVSGEIDCYGPEARIYLLQNGRKVAALDGTAMSANPGIANQLTGLAHGFTYAGLENFAAQCVALGRH